MCWFLLGARRKELLTIDSLMGRAQIGQTWSTMGWSKCQIYKNHNELVQSSTYLVFFFLRNEAFHLIIGGISILKKKKTWMVLVHMSLILHPRAENFLSSVWIAGGKFSNRADCSGFYLFWCFSDHACFIFFQLRESTETTCRIQVDLLHTNGGFLTSK